MEFSANVTNVSSSPEGENWGGRAAPVGAPVTGRYTYEINPNNSQQVINSTFEIEFGGLSWATTIHSFDVIPHTPPSGDGDRYQVLGVFGSVYPGGNMQTLEQFVIQLQSPPHTTAGLTPDAFGDLPDANDFPVHRFVYSLSFIHPQQTFIHLEATLTSFGLMTIVEPSALLLFLASLLGAGMAHAASRRTLAGGVV